MTRTDACQAQAWRSGRVRHILSRYLTAGRPSWILCVYEGCQTILGITYTVPCGCDLYQDTVNPRELSADGKVLIKAYPVINIRTIDFDKAKRWHQNTVPYSDYLMLIDAEVRPAGSGQKHLGEG